MSLRERIQRARFQTDRARFLTRIEEEYQRRIELLEPLDDEEDPRTQELAREIRQDTYWRLMEQAEDEPFVPLPPTVPYSDEEVRWREEMLLDRRTNLLWTLYIKQLLAIHPEALEFEEFSEIVCARAVVRLLAYVPNGPALLAELFPEGATSLPSREDAIQVVARGVMEERDPEVFLSRLFHELPGSRSATYRLLRAYKEVIREQALIDNGSAEDYDGELPDDELRRLPVTYDQVARLLGVDEEMPHEERIVVDLALERAITDAVRGRLSMRAAAAKYDIPRTTLSREMRRRGLSAPKKGKGSDNSPTTQSAG